MNAAVDSTSDARTVNNTMRHQYRVLSDADYRAHQADRDDRGDWDYERRKQERLDRQEDAR